MPTLRAVQALIDRFQAKGVIIGGAAVCLLGQARLTADVDAMLLVTNDDLTALLEAAHEVGFVPRRRSVALFARRNRLVPLHHPETKSDVDISLGAMPLEIEMVKRSRLMRYGNLRVRLPTIEDLIILKAIAHRDKDRLDIISLLEIYPKLDHARIEKWVREYADLMEMPELWDDIARLLDR